MCRTSCCLYWCDLNSKSLGKALTRHHEQGIMNLQPTACQSVSKQSNKLSHSLFQSPATHRGWCIVRLTDVPRPEATPSPANSRSPRQRLALERSGPNDDGCLVTQVPFLRPCTMLSPSHLSNFESQCNKTQVFWMITYPTPTLLWMCSYGYKCTAMT